MKIKNLIVCLLVVSFVGSSLYANNPLENEDGKTVERFALYVGSNRGGEGRDTLRYAGSDAQKIAATMLEVGGISSYNSHILVDPEKVDIERMFNRISADLENVSGSAKRTEFIFYYSGHSDETALLLGNERYSYSELKAAISNIPSEVHVVMLDSCFSGNFIRAKGGQRQKSFLIDDSSVVQGHAYLSSSSASESSQESDAIGSSFFTNSLVTGLRGAADTSGDNKVSLNELYHYAFNDTLYNTEESAAGPQHPSFNITLVGSGDLVLTDISEAEAILVLPEENSGRFLVRNASGALVSEVAKTAGTQIVLALPTGRYSVVAVTSKDTLQREVTLIRNFPVTLHQNSMVGIKRQKNALRGDGGIEADNEESVAENGKHKFNNMVEINHEEYGILHLSILPNLKYPLQYPKEVAENNILSGILFYGKDENITGIQWSFFLASIENDFIGWQHTGLVGKIKGDGLGFQQAEIVAIAADFTGVQTAGILSWANDFVGFQSASIFSRANDFSGVAFSGIFNWACNTKGSQIAGIFNKANDFTGAQIGGVFNYADVLKGTQISSVLNIAKETKGFQLSTINVAKNTTGVQLSVINVAKEIKGTQIGVINYAEKCSGFPIGLINIIPSGVFEFSTYLDSDNNVAIQYQGGTKYLYTTIVASTKNDFSFDYGKIGFGLGTRIPVYKDFSFDLEALWYDLYAKDADSDKDFNIPSARITANIPLLKHIKLFVAGNADVRVEDWNDDSFAFGDHNGKFASWTANNREVKLYSSVQVGLKFSLN